MNEEFEAFIADKHWDSLEKSCARVAWLASREIAIPETARRCVEIVLSDDYVWRGEVAEAISREFGL